VRAYLLNAPTWMLCLVQGSVFAVLTGVMSFATEHDSVAATVARAVVGGAVFGAVVGPVSARQSRQLRGAAGDLAPQHLRSAYRAAWRGPVPEDPWLREAARRIASHRLETILGQRRWASVLFGLLTVLSLVLAADSLGWLLATAVFVAALGAQLYCPRRLRSRIVLLTRADDRRPPAEP
jgi:hypothetical protein